MDSVFRNVEDNRAPNERNSEGDASASQIMPNSNASRSPFSCFVGRAEMEGRQVVDDSCLSWPLGCRGDAGRSLSFVDPKVVDGWLGVRV